MRIHGILLLLPLAMLSPSRADNERIQQWLQSDKDKDGALSRNETSGLMKRFFDRNDTDKDGTLSKSELEKIDRNLSARNQGKGKAPRKTPALPEGVIVRKNEVYREGHDRWKLDVYLPDGPVPERGRPGLVVVHGGGWKSGSKDGGQWASLPAAYAAKGYVCISVNYRLTGDGGGFPACVHDVKNAVRWFRANAEELGLDSGRIGAYGNSAGAHLVSMLGLVKKEDDLEGDGSHLDQSSLVQAVCASATPANFLSWKGEPFANRGLLEGDPETLEERAAEASPLTYVAKDAPPFLLIHAENDTVVPFLQGQSLAEKLIEAGATEVKLLDFDTGGHGVFGAKQKQTYPAMEAFFAKALQ